MTPQECLISYGEAWFERDPARRVEALRRCCTEDIVFMDPTLGRLEGLDAVSDMIGGYIGSWAERGGGSPPAESGEGPTKRGRQGSGVGVEVVTGVDVRHGFFRYSFIWTMPDGSRSGGTDFGEFAEDGRMRLITVWPGTAEFPVPGIE
jgi:hypothetical protein